MLKIKELREEKGISQQELANAVNISKSSISKYEKGDRTPELETFEAIADYFNVDMDYLKGKSEIRRKYIFTDDDNLEVDKKKEFAKTYISEIRSYKDNNIEIDFK